LKTRRGWTGLCFRDGELLRLSLPERTKRAVKSRMADACGDLRESPLPRVLHPLKRVLEAYFEGEEVDPAGLDVPLCFDGVTRFRRLVYEALREVPRGQVVTYGALAVMAGSPGAARGVGGAMARNRFSLLVPCHRVVAAARKIGGFSAEGGVATKCALLALEGWDGVTFYT
jgi:methylated-DNA-[protein]-cysteine S-methyltransferase